MSEAFITKPRSVWLEQVQVGQRAFEESGAETLDEFNIINHDAFAKMIEALYALGVQIAPDLIQKAGLRPVKEVLGLP